MSYSSEKRTSDSYERFNHSLDYDIYKARKTEPSVRNIEIKDHPLLGKKMRDVKTNQLWKVLKVNRQFHGGWYLGMLIEDERGSGTFRVFYNESSISDTIIRQANDFLVIFEEEV